MHRLLLCLAAFSACSVDLPDPSGLACDVQHPCGAGRSCIDGICRDEGGGAGGGGAEGGGMAGGGGGGGGGNASGGGVGTSDAGRVLWRQAEHGFSGNSRLGSAMLTVRTDAGNEVLASVPSTDDANDRATANQTGAAALSFSADGRWAGSFRLPAALTLKGNSTFARLEDGSNVVVSLAFNSAGALVVRSDPGMLGPTSLNQTITWPGGFSAGAAYRVDVSWRRGEFRTVFINGIDAGSLSTSDPLSGPLTPDGLRLGIYRYDGDAGTGWSITLFDWALADGPGVQL